MPRTWLGRFARPSARRPAPPRFTPGLVCLEDRSVPAAFYVDPALAGANNGDAVTFNAGQPNQKTGLTFGTDAFATVADGIAKTNAAAGADQLFLANGTHKVDPSAGTLVSTDALDIVGSGKANSTVLVTGDTLAATGKDGAVIRTEGPRLSVSALTFDGGGATGSPGGTFLVGSAFRFESAVGVVNDVAIKNVIDDSDPAVTQGRGVVAIGTGADVTVTNSTFANIGRVGVTFYGDGVTGLVSGSTFTGRANVLVQYGIDVVEGARLVQITGNTLTGFTGTDPNLAAAAVQVADDLGADTSGDANTKNEPASAVLVGNSITGNQFGVVIGISDTDDTSTAFLQFNTISGNGVGLSQADKDLGAGVLTDTTQQVSALRNFWGDKSGPKAVGNDTASGDNAGTGNPVGEKVFYKSLGVNPNDGILIAAPPVVSIPKQTGASLAALGTAVADKYIVLAPFDVVQPQPVFSPVVNFNTNTVTVFARFGEAVTGFDKTDLQVTGPGAVVQSVTPTSTAGEYAVVIAVTGEGTVTLAIPARAAQDLTGNYSLAAAKAAVAVSDRTAPTVALSSPAGAFPRPFADPFTVTVTFNETVTGFDAADLTVGGTAGGKVLSVAPDAANKVFTVSLGGFTSVGDVTLAVRAAAAEDAAGNATPAVAPVKVIDGTPPTVTISSPGGPLPRPFTDPLTAVFNFSEPVTGFDASDIVIGGGVGGKVTNLTANPTNTVFTATLGGFTKAGDVTVAVKDAAATDAAGNESKSAAAVTIADGTTPTPTIAAAGAGTLPIPFTDPLTFTVNFSEAVTGFDAQDVVLAGTQKGGKITNFVANSTNTVFTVTVGGFTTKGDLTVAIAAGAAADAAGNASTAAGPVTVSAPDVTPPAATIGIPAVTLPIPFNDPIAVVVTFSEAVTGFDAKDIVIGGTAKGGQVLSVVNTNGDNKSFTVTVGSFSANGTVILSVPAAAAQDAAGNDSLAVDPVLVASPNPTDTTPPTAAIGAASPLPLAYADPLTFTVTFSETVTGFDAADVLLGGTQVGGKVLDVTANSTNTVFTVRVGGFTTPGSVTVSVPAGAAQDAAGNASVVVPTTTLANAPSVDATAPTVVITSPAGALPVTFAASPLTLTFTFSEAVTGFDASDVRLGGTAKGATVLSVTPDAANKVFTVTLGGFTSRGSVTVGLDAGAAADAAGNQLAAVPAITAGQFVPPFSRGFAVGGDRPGVQPFYPVGEDLKAGNGVVPFEAGYTGGVRVATADVNGDGTLDIIVGSGVGRVNEVKIYDGKNPTTVLFSFNPFESTFTGGVFVAAADFNGDGKAEVVITPDETGGPRVQILDGANLAAGKVSPVLNDFFGIDDPDFRGGARAGTGDLNGDGVPDLFVSAGFGGGPRIAIFDGKQLLAGSQVRLVPDFFGYESTLRNGAFIDGGDLDGDGKSEVILGAGPGGGPRVRVLSGASLLADSSQVEVLNFFAFDENNRGGVRVAGTDIDGNGQVDIVTGPGAGGGSQVRVYLNGSSTSTNLSLFGDFDNGVFVG